MLCLLTQTPSEIYDFRFRFNLIKSHTNATFFRMIRIAQRKRSYSVCMVIVYDVKNTKTHTFAHPYAKTQFIKRKKANERLNNIAHTQTHKRYII